MGIKELIEKIKEDEAFANKYSGLADTAAFVEQAKKDGYTITAEELAKLAKPAADGKISDDELESVAGGNTTTTQKCRKCNGNLIKCPVMKELRCMNCVVIMY